MSSSARTALVTGAGRGLGRALCDVLLAEGWQVIACVRAPGGTHSKADDPRLQFEILDQGDPASIAALAGRLSGLRLDLIVHNAAIRGDTGGLAGATMDDFLSVMQTNVAGPLLLTQALLGQVVPAGCVAFISSRAGSMAEGHDPDGDYAYCASKAALNRLVVKLADDHPQIFLALHPGWVRTDMGGPGAKITPAASAAALLALIGAAGPEDSGTFRAHDGAPIRW